MTEDYKTPSHADHVNVIEQCAKLCDIIANRPVKGPESGSYERAERRTAKLLAAEIRALSGATLAASERPTE